jgi:hypothetical protein
MYMMQNKPYYNMTYNNNNNNNNNNAQFTNTNTNTNMYTDRPRL